MPEFKNPSQGGGGSQDSRSFLVMMVVMIGVIFGLQYWQAKHNPKTQEPSPPAAQTAAVQTGGASAALAAVTQPSAPTSPSVPTVQAAAATTTVVENELYRITFSNRGAQVVSWVLKGYKDSEGNPLDLVHDGAAKQFGYPLSLYTYDANITKTLAQAMYVASATGTLQAPASLNFEYAAGNLVVHKTFTFGADYVIHIDATVLRDGAPIRALASWPGGFGDMETLTAYGSSTIDTSTGGKEEQTDIKKVIGGATLNGPFDFAGVSDQYFGAVFLPDQPSDATIATFHQQMEVHDVPRGTGRGIHTPLPTKNTSPVPVLGAAAGNLSGHNQMRLFVGPKSIKVLKSVTTTSGGTLEPLLDFGFWGPVGKLLFLGLQAVHAHIAPNWGWAIILFTVCINLVLLPLRVQGMKSMLKMQRIQPGIDAIKAKYKNPGPTDPKSAEMNAEVMAYQKEQGVSMFGGCIPTLIQLPLLFAFFTMMTRVVELRQAHWYWLPDLSSADPWHILPVMMLITSFLAQYYTPSPGVDPQQQKMMAFMMPAFSMYMTWNYAAGLALYWNVGNLIMITQQQIMNRTSLGREMKEIAAKRARQKLGAATRSAKTIQGKR